MHIIQYHAKGIILTFHIQRRRAVERKFAELPNTNLDEKVRQVENEIIPFWNRFCSPPFAMMVLQSRLQR